jgi:hypothetical protein
MKTGRRNIKLAYQQNKGSTRREKLAFSVAASALLVSTLFLYGPVNMYGGNPNDLWFPLSAIFPALSIAAAGLFLVLTALGHFLPTGLGRGWHGNEQRHTWSREKAELFLPLDPTRDAILDFRLVYPPPAQDRVNININGHDLGDWSEEIRGQAQWEYHKKLALPKSCLAKDGMNRLILTMPAPVSSAADPRLLGLPVMSISVK